MDSVDNYTNYVYLDTETTGFSHKHDEILEISIIDHNGIPLVNTLVRPKHKTDWKEAQAIHGISFEMIRYAPTLKMLADRINKAVSGKDVVIYNKRFDYGFLVGYLDFANSTVCCMEDWKKEFNLSRWVKLIDAAEKSGHTWTGEAHRSLEDARATLSTWVYLKSIQQNNKSLF